MAPDSYDSRGPTPERWITSTHLTEEPGASIAAVAHTQHAEEQFMDDKLLITVAPCIPPYVAEAIPGLDLSPEGIADEVVRACNAGASIAHLHVWDEIGQPTMELAAFERTICLIRAQCDIIIEGSTGGINDLSPGERSVSLQADVEMASLNAGSVNYDSGVYINSPDDIAYWVEEMQRRGIKLNVSVFETGMITNALEFAEQGMIELPLLFSFVLGQTGAMPASAKNLLFLSESIPREGTHVGPGESTRQGARHGTSVAQWAVAGHGEHDLEMAGLAILMGGHARAGYEDNPYYRPEEMATSNAQLIERLARLAQELGRPVASPAEGRELLGIRR